MALSKRTLSGCLDPTFASGLTDFLLVQAAVISNNVLITAINENLRDMNTSNCSCGDTAPGCPAERSSAICFSADKSAGGPQPVTRPVLRAPLRTASPT